VKMVRVVFSAPRMRQASRRASDAHASALVEVEGLRRKVGWLEWGKLEGNVGGEGKRGLRVLVSLSSSSSLLRWLGLVAYLLEDESLVL
jgi:hypothetical protein